MGQAQFRRDGQDCEVAATSPCSLLKLRRRYNLQRYAASTAPSRLSSRPPNSTPLQSPPTKSPHLGRRAFILPGDSGTSGSQWGKSRCFRKGRIPVQTSLSSTNSACVRSTLHSAPLSTSITHTM